MLVVRLYGARPWIRDGSAAGDNGLDGIISGWMKGGFDEGVEEKEGQGTSEIHQRETE